MATAGRKKAVKSLEDTIQVIPHGSQGHAELLEAGYGMTVEEAKLIIAERKENALSHPYERVQAAQAMLEALAAKKPLPSSNKPGWKRTRNR